ncbi:hypothetical protein GCM10009530_24680 [Microbispora corallina]
MLCTTTSAPSPEMVTAADAGRPPVNRQPKASSPDASASRPAAPGQSRGTPIRVVLLSRVLSYPRSDTAADVSTQA